ncbi:hypothetical protein [Paraflavitalea sp. CAU 1676]|uniref:hypothetical protein n=1 Tax=Paraflavitalea sp. CAU 1676 TaxID=3032598 RepID=UPI0023DC1AC6|nr:hypothetical protein [Paraflavitalea sp. CAU 1676]MDF2188321.1 hypothetical protein [Paraflavitalea sp. CAU 1676]
MSSSNNLSEISGFVDVEGYRFRDDLASPIQIQLLNQNLSLLSSIWSKDGYFNLPAQEKGTYVIRAILLDGQQIDRVITVDGETPIDELLTVNNKNTRTIVLSDTHVGWQPKHRSLIKGPYDAIYKGFPTNIFRLLDRIILWERLPRGKWLRRVWSDERIFPDVTGTGFTWENYEKKSFAIEVAIPNAPSNFVCIPPTNKLFVTVSRVRTEGSDQTPYEFNFQTRQWANDALLTMLTRGPVVEEETLFNAISAEFLLQNKKEDPAGAAIGGYYLLKMQAWDRMHDWTNNLANWFLWMPDGAIIDAWFLMSKTPKTDEDIIIIKKRLLQGFRRGIPIYTEGLRLLHDGLEKIAVFLEGRDKFVNSALSTVRAYVAKANMSRPTCTLIDFHPKN